MTTGATIRHFGSPKPCDCGGTLKPVAHNTGDGWTWGGECDTCGEWFGDDDDGGERYPWPFVGNWAEADDWRVAGYALV